MRKIVLDLYYPDAGNWEEGKHPRGQPENAGEFAANPGGSQKPTVKASPAAAKPISYAKVPSKYPKGVAKTERFTLEDNSGNLREVWVNPNKGQVERLLQKTRSRGDPELRMMYAKGNLVVADAYDNIHYDMWQVLKQNGFEHADLFQPDTDDNKALFLRSGRGILNGTLNGRGFEIFEEIDGGDRLLKIAPKRWPPTLKAAVGYTG